MGVFGGIIEVLEGREAKPEHPVHVNSTEVYLIRTPLEVEAVDAIARFLKVGIGNIRFIKGGEENPSGGPSGIRVIIQYGQNPNPFEYYEGTIAKIKEGYRVELKRVDSPEVQGVKNTIRASLGAAFGLTSQAIQRFGKEGLLKIHVQLETLKAEVEMSPEIRRAFDLRQNAALIDPLGEPVLPKMIHFNLAESSERSMAPCVGEPNGFALCPGRGFVLEKGEFQIGELRFALDFIDPGSRGKIDRLLLRPRQHERRSAGDLPAADSRSYGTAS